MSDVSAASSRWNEVMERALVLATHPDAPVGVNPRVGCVITDEQGHVVGEGFHRGAGTAHAEVMALAMAGERAHGGTAIVTLEPCNHHGRTGPCTEALLSAGITRVVYASPDPHGVASGGADALAQAGVEVMSGVRDREAREINREWFLAHERDRPFVRWKIATTLDHRVSRHEGERTQITGSAAASYVQELRRGAQAILVGTSTAIIDNPHLTVRGAASQPLRVVVGRREIPTGHHLHEGGSFLQFRTHDLAEVLQDLWERGVVTVLLEGGPTVAAAFMQAGFIDEIVVIQAPVVWGSGPEAFVRPFEADLRGVEVLGKDVAITLVPNVHGGKDDR